MTGHDLAQWVSIVAGILLIWFRLAQSMDSHAERVRRETAFEYRLRALEKKD